MELLAVGSEKAFGWVTFSGKCTVRILIQQCWTHVEDSFPSGTSRLWLETRDKSMVVISDLSMPVEAYKNAEDLVGGNVVVPH